MANHRRVRLSYRDCSAKLDILPGQGWRPVDQANLRACTDNLQGVPAATEGLLRFQLQDGLATGTYRIRIERMWVVREHDANDGIVPAEQLITNAFAVRL